jgi:hypothetical protein
MCHNAHSENIHVFKASGEPRPGHGVHLWKDLLNDSALSRINLNPTIPFSPLFMDSKLRIPQDILLFQFEDNF